ncbi:MAG TPA: thioredoxin domain-containing protein [Burkholderiales bacterium]|nr:thioredoxin domain-containing protein [Burkholderiales bacterium]
MPNRLAHETSPYLQQHADNPVDWHPWSEEALDLAHQQNKPILLSVGYSACHWCHVMAHESFEDEGVAAIMNQHFVNIKVDREERPDLDQIYQTAHQMLTQRTGGWPLTMFLTPDGKPFFGGTYFPKTPRYNLPGFGALLERVAEFYAEKRQEIEEQNTRLVEALRQTGPTKPETDPTLQESPLNEAMAGIRASFDAQQGGLGGAPKFPHAAELEFSLRRYAATGENDARHITTFTLEKMALGGIYDQLGGGFCRYSVDNQWMIPHFEKMLYDNGPLLRLVADAWVITGNPLFERIADETAAWVIREMQSPEGGYYSTLDADSEGEEGKFYVWTPAEAQSLLTPAEYHVASLTYGLDGPPNFEGSHWHLRVVRDIDVVAEAIAKPIDEAYALLTSARAKLFAHREKRIRPGRDEKILTSWNGLMIQGMARAGFAFDRPEWIASAHRAMDFIRQTMWKNGRLLATYKDGRAHLNAYLDDHAFLLAALIDLLQADYRNDNFDFALQLADVLLDQFEDKDNGGFFFVSHDHESLIHRTKSGQDNATPSGNGVAALALMRLSHLTDDMRYSEAAERTLRLFYRDLTGQPFGNSTLLMALEEALQPTRLIVIRGPASELTDWRNFMRKQYCPTSLVFFLTDDANNLPINLAKPAKGHVNAWVCQGVNCLPPISAISELQLVLEAKEI